MADKKFPPVCPLCGETCCSRHNPKSKEYKAAADEKFTPGAMRAALLIGRTDGFHWVDTAIDKCSEIISRETADAALIDALEDLLTAIGDELPYNFKAMRNVRLTAESALRKAREGEMMDKPVCPQCIFLGAKCAGPGVCGCECHTALPPHHRWPTIRNMKEAQALRDAAPTTSGAVKGE